MPSHRFSMLARVGLLMACVDACRVWELDAGSAGLAVVVVIERRTIRAGERRACLEAASTGVRSIVDPWSGEVAAGEEVVCSDEVVVESANDSILVASQSATFAYNPLFAVTTAYVWEDAVSLRHQSIGFYEFLIILDFQLSNRYDYSFELMCDDDAQISRQQ
jgi:hypothetical protein